MYHSGEWMGAHTYVSRYPEEGMWLVILDNSSNPYFDSISETLEEELEKLLDAEHR